MTAYWEIAAHSAYDMFSKDLIDNLVSSRLELWGGHFFLIVSFPDHCLLVPFGISDDAATRWAPSVMIYV